MSTAAEEKWMAENAIRQHMFDAAAAGHMQMAREAEERLTRIEDMTVGEFITAYPNDTSDIS
jgi:hypothetical protein